MTRHELLLLYVGGACAEFANQAMRWSDTDEVMRVLLRVNPWYTSFSGFARAGVWIGKLGILLARVLAWPVFLVLSSYRGMTGQRTRWNKVLCRAIDVWKHQAICSGRLDTTVTDSRLQRVALRTAYSKLLRTVERVVVSDPTLQAQLRVAPRLTDPPDLSEER